MTTVQVEECRRHTLTVHIVSIQQCEVIAIWDGERSFRSIGLLLSVGRSQPDVRNCIYRLTQESAIKG